MLRPRLIASAATALLLLPLAACGGAKEPTTSTAAEETTAAQPTASTAQTQAASPAETKQEAGPAPEACKALTAEEVKKVLDLTYTVSGGGAQTAKICSYKGSDPLNPMISLTINQLGAGMTLDSFAKTLADSMKGESKKITVPGADDARELTMASSPLEMILAEKDGHVYQLQFGDVSKKFPVGKGKELMAEALN